MRAEVRKAGVNRRTLGQGPLGSSRRGKTGGSVSHNVSHRVERLAGGGGEGLGNKDIFSTGPPAGTRDAAMTAARFARADSAATSLSCGVNSSMVKMFLTAPFALIVEPPFRAAHAGLKPGATFRHQSKFMNRTSTGKAVAAATALQGFIVYFFFPR